VVRILFLGDVFGNAGLDAVERHVPALREELDLDLVLANGENVAGGAGITARLGARLLAAGIDCLTLGNHTWRRDGTGAYLASAERVVRPANYLRTLPGRGMLTLPARDGTPVTVLNLLGRLTLEPACSPFEIVDRLVTEAQEASPILVVDVHAEATSEKAALARYLDGRVSAVVGTHTHVQTSDATVLPKGTAFITDAGMTGPHDSVIGVEAELAIRRMRTGMPVRFETAQGGVRIEGAVVDCDAATGKASSIEAIRVPVS